jgi:hypothetical protein
MEAQHLVGSAEFGRKGAKRRILMESLLAALRSFPFVTCSPGKPVNYLYDARLGFIPSVCRQFRRQLARPSLPHMLDIDAQYFLHFRLVLRQTPRCRA